MQEPTPPAADRNQVSASDLVRQFGIWQERANHHPVYVMHRGRPRLVLTSVELMQRLCSPHADQGSGETEHALLLDTMAEPVIRVDDALAIAAINKAATAWTGRTSAQSIGHPLAALMGESVGTYLDALVRRARRFGGIEAADFAVEDRHVAFTIVPIPSGALVIGNDRTAQEGMSETASAATGLRAAVSAANGVAQVQVNQRGYLDRPDDSLTDLIGVPIATLATARFVTLVATDTRVAVGEALDRVLRDGKPRTVAATMPRRRGADIAVSIGIAAICPRLAIEAAQLIVVERQG